MFFPLVAFSAVSLLLSARCSQRADSAKAAAVVVDVVAVPMTVAPT